MIRIFADILYQIIFYFFSAPRTTTALEMGAFCIANPVYERRNAYFSGNAVRVR